MACGGGSLPDDIRAALGRLGLAGDGSEVRAVALSGGVSSDIWKVETGGRTVCVKRALPRLKVAADWRAPVARNAFEAAWIETAGAIVPDAVPRLLGHDPEAGLIAMDYLDPGEFLPWKEKLRRGRAEAEDARAVAAAIAAIHGATAGRDDIARRFASDGIFHAIRLEPYLESTARAHPDLAPALNGIVATTAATRLALVHGDVSPKNILIGPRGPVLLDAECAWYGDPAFDLAFCLNHLLLKCLWTPEAAPGFLGCFDVLAEIYLTGVDWESREALESRAAPLLAGLFLARIDGKSPVEYVTEEADKARVRRVARALLQEPVDSLGTVRAAWAAELGL
ncbi:MAG: phosphotransferase [Defluviicoccus sp.]|nr:phosphotransferase [Defluviicoccus sp.]